MWVTFPSLPRQALWSQDILNRLPLDLKHTPCVPGFELQMTQFIVAFSCFPGVPLEQTAQIQHWFITDIFGSPLAKCVSLGLKPAVKDKMFCDLAKTGKPTRPCVILNLNCKYEAVLLPRCEAHWQPVKCCFKVSVTCPGLRTSAHRAGL